MQGLFSRLRVFLSPKLHHTSVLSEGCLRTDGGERAKRPEEVIELGVGVPGG